MIKRSAFLPIASPRLVKEPPTGPDWLHEVKFDGFRIQIHKAGDEIRLFSRNGKDFTDRFPAIAAAPLRLEAKKAVIDGELVVCDGSDRPDFYALLGRRISGLCVWCFDLLSLNGRDLRSHPLQQRKAKLEALLLKTGNDATLRLSHTFEDGEKLLAAAARQGLEGIVSKRRLGVYVPGAGSGWVKIKTAQWREANCGRWELFQKTGALTERSTNAPAHATAAAPSSFRNRDDLRKTEMAMLHRFTLKYNKRGGWDLKDQTGEVIKTFNTKGEALTGGKLEKLLGKQGGTVRIHRQDGQFAEERTYPRSRDPRASPG